MKKILILFANPRGDLSLSQEIQDLKNFLVKNINFDVEIETAVSVETLEDRLSRYQPFIVHFCGHGTGKKGLVFVNKEGIEQPLSNNKLADTLKNYGERIECVLLNACYTEVQADAITEYIPYVIGTSREILDKVAHYFSIGFYKGIAEEQRIETCYEWGYISIKSNLENAELVTSINKINSKSRKVEVIDDGTNRSTAKPLEIILKRNKFLESQFASNVSPKLEQEFIEEGKRKRYKDNLRNILDNFGQRIVNREKQISDFELQQRDTLINKVQDFWIDGFLKPSLYFSTTTDVDNDHPSEQILRPLDNLEVIPFDIEQSYDSVKNTDITDQINNGQTLLILGEPGSGKTIALLQLAERLVAESRENYKQSIPIVFNLSSWVEKQQSLEEWLVEELRDKYQVPKACSKPWIEKQELTLLLDGLDEVKANHRNACVKKIREFSSTHQATEIFVCSRIKEYEALAERLLLSSVICIQPLSKQQLLDFLKNADDSLLGLKTVIEQDSEIFQFATTPLILNMMTWTYDDWSVEQCYEQFQNPRDREFNLFESYIEKNLKRENIEKKYRNNQVFNWLSWLAITMVNESKIIFLIEKMQPNLLQNQKDQIEYRISNFLIVGLIFGLGGGVSYGLLGGLSYGQSYGLLVGLTYSLIGGLLGGVITGLSPEIKLFEQINWSWQKARSHGLRDVMSYALIFGLGGGLIFGLTEGIIYGFSNGLREGFSETISGILFGILIGGIKSGLISNEVEQSTITNQGIWSSRKNAIKMSRSYGLIGGTYSCVLEGLIFGIAGGFGIALIGGLLNGGATCIKHFNLRRILHRKDYIPWNYARFLDYATERLFMKKVGGGYIFYHRMLMEHFAQRNQVFRESVSVAPRKTFQPIAQTSAKTTVHSSSTSINSSQSSTTKLTSDPVTQTNQSTEVNSNTIIEPNKSVLDLIICDSCNHQNPNSNQFCIKCGQRLSDCSSNTSDNISPSSTITSTPKPVIQTNNSVSDFIICSSCNQQNPNTDKFCIKCGQKLIHPSSAGEN